MSDYISKSEVMTILTDVELKEGTFTEAKSKIRDIPPADETEIIRKAFDRVLERLDNLKDGYNHSCLDNAYQRGVGDGAKWLKKKAIEIVKEECGISE